MCSVVRCDSWRRRAQRFILPADPERRLEWVQFLFEVNGQRLKESSWTDIRVCSEHFTRSCFHPVTQAAGSARLKWDAVPSVYVPDDPESKQDIIEPCECDQLKTYHSPTPGSSVLNKEENAYLISAPASPASTEVFESSESDYCKMLEKIENLDIIKEKVSMLQMSKRYVVNEKQLLQLFSATCPLCQSEVKTEKAVCGVLLALNQQCLQCDYKKHWKNLTKKSITALSDGHQTECMEISLKMFAVESKKMEQQTERMSSQDLPGLFVPTIKINPGSKTISTKTVGITEIVQVVDEESDHTTEPDESSDPGEAPDSDDSWEPEDEPLVLDSEEEDSSFEEISEDADLKHRELCTDCGMFFEKQKPHTCEYKMKPFSCNICGKRCVSDHALTVHSRVHSVNYEHPCKFCHVGFKTKMDKITHEQSHLNQKSPYKCPDCSETFATYKKRKEHLKSHTERRPLKCPICGIEFFWALALQRHSIVHTGEKPFRCSVCERGFNQRGHLKSHMRLHTGERPYKCNQCDKCFNHNVSLKSHIQRCHQQKTTNSQGDGGASSGAGKIEEDQGAEKVVSTKRRKRRTTTGRPIGRPKKKPTGAVIKEKALRHAKNPKAAELRKRKPKRRPSSSEEEKLSESEDSLDLMEEEEQ